jgi:predicted helicase
MAEVYRAETASFSEIAKGLSAKERQKLAQRVVTKDPKKISWTPNLLRDLEGEKPLNIKDDSLTEALYRPFSKTWAYTEKQFIWSRYRIPSFFPDSTVGNRIIVIHGAGENLPFTALMCSLTPDVHMLHGGQCFPRLIYDQGDEEVDGSRRLGDAIGGRKPRDAISDKALVYFEERYPGEIITKDDLFYYVYGLLHSPDYRSRFADNLSKQLPRIPAVKSAAAFRAFTQAGRELGDLHCDFDSAEPYPVTIAQGDLRLAHIPDPASFFRVERMRFAGKRPNLDRTSIIYNHNITITAIPLEAYEFVVNGKPALEWVMERQCVKVDPASGIASDANSFANETMGDPAYPFELFCRMITVSIKTLQVVRSLPSLDIDEQGVSVGQDEPISVIAN